MPAGRGRRDHPEAIGTAAAALRAETRSGDRVVR
jgi:hypothetical protein